MRRLAKIPPAVLELVRRVAAKLAAAVQEAWYSEPVAVTGAVVAAIVAVFGALGIVIQASTIQIIVTAILPLIVAAIGRHAASPTAKARIKGLALARAGSSRHVLAAFLFRRTALAGQVRIERLQAAAREEAGSWPPTDEPARQTLYQRFAGQVTPEARLTIARATHKERGRWVVEVLG